MFNDIKLHAYTHMNKVYTNIASYLGKMLLPKKPKVSDIFILTISKPYYSGVKFLVYRHITCIAQNIFSARLNAIKCFV